MYSLMHQHQADGFKFMSGVDSLEALRGRIRLRGSKVGAAKCVWADGFAMETIATHYQLLLLIVDERSAQKFTRISPLALGADGAPIQQGQSMEQLPPTQPTVLLHSSQREHMNLILYDGRRMQLLGNLPLELQRLWNLAVLPDGSTPPAPVPSPAKVLAPPPIRKSTATGKRKVSKAEAARLAAVAAAAANRSDKSAARAEPPPDANDEGAPISLTKRTRGAGGSNGGGSSSSAPEPVARAAAAAARASRQRP